MNDDCILWPGRLNSAGYGTLGADLAHRRMWEKNRGPIPDGMTVDHLCHDPLECRAGVKCEHRSCVNPSHMRISTYEENRERGGFRLDRVESCRRGHPYAADNLVHYSGKRHCRTCRQDQQRSRWVTVKAAACREAGHERDEATGRDGRKYCRICIRENAAMGNRAQLAAHPSRKAAVK